MKNISQFLVFLILLGSLSCKKSKPTGPVAEPNIVFTTSANSTNTSISNSFPVTVTLTSPMPSSSGININTTVIDQTNNATIPQNGSVNSTSPINNIQLVNLPRQRWCTVTITVTSLATPSNSATRTFDVAYK